MSGRSVAFAVDAGTIALTDDDRVHADAVRRRGIEVHPLLWGAQPTSDEPVVIRSPFDYVERSAEFSTWLDDLDAAGVCVINPTSLLRWNMHKGYLAELAHRGVAVVPTEMLGQGSHRSLGEVMAARDWSRVVVKPAIGASARETIRVDGEDRAAVVIGDDHVRRLVAVEDVLIQPFLPSIETEGEVSVSVGLALTRDSASRQMQRSWPAVSPRAHTSPTSTLPARQPIGPLSSNTSSSHT